MLVEYKKRCSCETISENSEFSVKVKASQNSAFKRFFTESSNYIYMNVRMLYGSELSVL